VRLFGRKQIPLCIPRPSPSRGTGKQKRGTAFGMTRSARLLGIVDDRAGSSSLGVSRAGRDKHNQRVRAQRDAEWTIGQAEEGRDEAQASG
jgi:hypothetical protein